MSDKGECACDLNKALCNASEEELVAFYKHITGTEPKPEQIKAMKGMCKLEPGIEIMKARQSVPPVENRDPSEDVKQSIEEENKAVQDYVQRAATAAYADDPKTEQLFLHIAGEEVHHAGELTNRKKELGG